LPEHLDFDLLALRFLDLALPIDEQQYGLGGLDRGMP
jgi:hypothetical protein